MIYIDYDNLYMPSYSNSFNQSFAIGEPITIEIPKTKIEEQ